MLKRAVVAPLRRERLRDLQPRLSRAVLVP